MVNEDQLETECMEWFDSIGYQTLHGSKIDPASASPERDSLSEVMLLGRLRKAIEDINSGIPESAREDAITKLRQYHANTAVANKTFHRQLIEGIQVEYHNDKGELVGDRVYLIDFKNKHNNDWLAVQQYSVDGVTHGEKDNRIPDIVVFINGLPISVIELKNPRKEETDVWAAYNQLQTYKNTIKDLFVCNEAMIISDGTVARIGSLTADRERFMHWRTIDGSNDDTETMLELEVMIRGFFDKDLLLDYLQFFVTYEASKDSFIKKQAGYHQFHGVRDAVVNTVKATRPDGDQRCGVFWHTQGSGKSLSMVYYSAKLMATTELENPTIVIVTDRNDLDDQLFETFLASEDLLRQKPIQCLNRTDIRDHLEDKPAGGIFFTTMQKFQPEKGETEFKPLSNRHNIIVGADEAHRSQYGMKARIDQKTGQMKYGYAHHLRTALPNAGFIGFTGTPIETEDKDTQHVFGSYVSIYDIEQAQKDEATKPLYYESRLIKMDLNTVVDDEDIEDEVEDATDGYDEQDQSRFKSKNAALEALVTEDKRVEKLASDFVTHFEKREEVMLSKAMLVCISREACVKVYNAIKKLRLDWHDEDPLKGSMKVIMTGNSSDKQSFQEHIHKKPIQRKIAERVRDPDSELKLIIVCDMWLTGFDAPCLNTMYIDKPLKGHNLMQSIARVNRVFRDKEGGLIVDYLGIAEDLKNALANYTANNGKGRPTVDIDEAMSVFKTKLDVCQSIMHGFDYSGFEKNALKLLAGAMNHVFKGKDGKKRFDRAVLALSKAFSLCSTHDDANQYKEEVAFFETIRAAIKKSTLARKKLDSDKVEHALRQVVSKAIVTGEVVDVFKSAGLNKPEISILDDQFLNDVKKMEHKNLAVEMLQKLIEDEIRTRTAKNAASQRSFMDMLAASVAKYKNKAVHTSQVIEELIKLAKELRESADRGEEIGLTKEELAFYDALLENESAKDAMTDDDIVLIAKALVEEIRNSSQPDWEKRPNLRSKMRRNIKKILKRTGYPPDYQAEAVEAILKQAEVMA
ncbi:type I restriction endonuclease subunit R [Opacimonas viscosa]|uniref:Type I restriction enzyme endonuclease subunit n=1 Tax=Opacimonas viscosa TaxID=2961944 RepID=A0AA41X063_9ALTE|nr:type I restriction endonuclease subunit R [Opacimonas viscosa]MCP3429724.1 type I restriction endonuclease subunit R [Opacimonas viscosa]